MKLAVPTRAGQVDERLGHCESLTIYEFDDDKAVIGQERFTPPPACDRRSDLIPLLVKKGVRVLVAGDMGAAAALELRRAGIEVFSGVRGDVAEAVRAWTEGSLKRGRRAPRRQA